MPLPQLRLLLVLLLLRLLLTAPTAPTPAPTSAPTSTPTPATASAAGATLTTTPLRLLLFPATAPPTVTYGQYAQVESSPFPQEVSAVIQALAEMDALTSTSAMSWGCHRGRS